MESKNVMNKNIIEVCDCFKLFFFIMKSHKLNKFFVAESFQSTIF